MIARGRRSAKGDEGPQAPAEDGNFLPMANIPWLGDSQFEMTPGRGGQLVRSAGTAATLMALADGYAQVKLPSGEIRKLNEKCSATMGTVGNSEHEKIVLDGGPSPAQGQAPDHACGGEEPGRSPDGGGEAAPGGGHPMSPWGVLAKGFKTRPKYKPPTVGFWCAAMAGR